MSEPLGSGVHPGPARVVLPAAIRMALVDHARAAVPNEACGLIIGDRPAADGGQRAALAADSQSRRLALSLRDRFGRPAPGDDRDRRRGRGLLGDRPLARGLAGPPVADGHRPGVLPGRALRAGLAPPRRGRSGDRRGRHPRLAHRRGPRSTRWPSPPPDRREPADALDETVDERRGHPRPRRRRRSEAVP